MTTKANDVPAAPEPQGEALGRKIGAMVMNLLQDQFADAREIALTVPVQFDVEGPYVCATPPATPSEAADEIALVLKWIRDNEPVSVSQIMEVLRNREGVNRIKATRIFRAATVPTANYEAVARETLATFENRPHLITFHDIDGRDDLIKTFAFALSTAARGAGDGRLRAVVSIHVADLRRSAASFRASDFAEQYKRTASEMEKAANQLEAALTTTPLPAASPTNWADKAIEIIKAKRDEWQLSRIQANTQSRSAGYTQRIIAANEIIDALTEACGAEKGRGVDGA